MKFPSVKKAFGRIASCERISRKTVRLVGAALLSAGLTVGSTSVSKASVGEAQMQAAYPGTVIVIPAPPQLHIIDGTMQVAGHSSHSSHASHGSHGSHCSGYSYC